MLWKVSRLQLLVHKVITARGAKLQSFGRQYMYVRLAGEYRSPRVVSKIPIKEWACTLSTWIKGAENQSGLTHQIELTPPKLESGAAKNLLFWTYAHRFAQLFYFIFVRFIIVIWPHSPVGTEALSHFGQHFFVSLRELEETCSRRRQELAEATNQSAGAHTQPASWNWEHYYMYMIISSEQT